MDVSDKALTAERAAVEVLARVSASASPPIASFDVLEEKVSTREPVVLTSDFAKTMLDDLRRAQGIADDAARSTVELECQLCDATGAEASGGVTQGFPWYDTRKVRCRFAMPMLIEALIYLDKRGIVYRDARKRYLVTFQKPETH